MQNFLFIPLASAQTSSNIAEAAGSVGDNTVSQLGMLVSGILLQIPLWIAAAVVVVLTFIVARLARTLVENKLAEKGVQEEHQEIQIVASRVTGITVIIVGITVALSLVGIDLQPIVAAGAFGLGFASKDLIMNFVAGMLILGSRHYTIGDIIKVGAVLGRIEEIQTRATIIKAFDGTKVVVPNSHLFKNIVISKTSNPYRKISLIMGVSYDSDLRRTVELTLEALKGLPEILKKPKPSVVFYEWGDYSIDFRINFWIDTKTKGQFVKAKNAVMIRLSEIYNQSGINIPYPIQTLNFEMDQDDNAKTDKLIGDLKSKRQAKEEILMQQMKQRAAYIPAAPQSGEQPNMQPASIQPNQALLVQDNSQTVSQNNPVWLENAYSQAQQNQNNNQEIVTQNQAPAMPGPNDVSRNPQIAATEALTTVLAGQGSAQNAQQQSPISYS